MRKDIKIQKRPPIPCDRCDSPAMYWISFNDPAKPGAEMHFGGSRPYNLPTIVHRACDVHLVDVNYAVLVEAGLAPALPLNNLLRKEPYVGTTGEPKTEG